MLNSTATTVGNYGVNRKSKHASVKPETAASKTQDPRVSHPLYSIVCPDQASVDAVYAKSEERAKRPVGKTTVSTTASVKPAAPKPKAAPAEAPVESAVSPMKLVSPVNAWTKAIEAEGFKHAGSEIVGDMTAHGFTHSDGRAVLYAHKTVDETIGQLWQIRHPQGVEAGGKDLSTLKIALPQVPSRSDLASVRKTEQATPQHIIRAVNILGGVTTLRYDLSTLSGDKNYGRRVTLLKKLLQTDRVLVKDSGLKVLETAFHSAVGAQGKTIALKSADFVARCKAIAAAARKAKSAATKAEAAAKKASMAMARFALQVPGTILPMSPPKTKEECAIEVAALKFELASMTADEMATTPANCTPFVQMQFGFDSSAFWLVEYGEFTMLRLEESNSQGALHLYVANGRLVTGVITTAMGLECKSSSHDISAVQLYLDSLRDVPAEPAVAKAYQAALRALEITLAPLTLAQLPRLASVKAPRDAAANTKLITGWVGLLEDPEAGLVALQLERENTQGAICVYNKCGALKAGVIPPSILQTLRPVLGRTDMIEAVNQLLNPPANGATVTPIASRYLTEVLNSKEFIAMATKKTASKKFEVPNGTATQPVTAKKEATAATQPVTAKKEATAAKKPAKEVSAPRKASTYRLINATKSTWSAFKGQKETIVKALVKAGAVGVKAQGITAAALAEATDVAPKNVAFYMSVWQKDPAVIEKVAAA